MNPQSSKKKGNKKMNGFSILLFEHKRNLQKTGREISNCELQEECDILWKVTKNIYKIKIFRLLYQILLGHDTRRKRGIS